MFARHRPTAVATLVATAALTALPVPALAAVSGPLSGFADADLLQVEGVSLPAGCGDESDLLLGVLVACELQVAGLVVADSEARVDSAADIDYDGDTGLSAYGHGSNLDVALLSVSGGDALVAADLLVRSDARQLGGDTRDDDELLSLPDNPLVGLDIAVTQGIAVDVGDGNDACVEFVDGRGIIAAGRSELLDLRVLPDALGDGADLVATSNPIGVSYASSTVELVDALVGAADDELYGVESIATVQLVPVVLFGGAVTVEITQPVLTVSHDGQTATTAYATPIVTINGDTVVDGDSIEILDALDVPLSPVLTLEVGIADQEDVVVDGTTSTVSGVVTLDLVVGDTLGVASITFGDLTASAVAPAGGVTVDDCATPAPAGAPDPDPADPSVTGGPDLPNTGGGAAVAGVLALGVAAALRGRRGQRG